MTTSEQDALLAKHGRHQGGWSDPVCSRCAVTFPCDVHRMAELKDAEIAEAVSEAVERIVEALKAEMPTYGDFTVIELRRAIALLRSRDWSKGEGE